MSEESTNKIVVEKDKQLSKAIIWKLQQEYFAEQGINAWVNQVPFYITSNPFIANSYAKLVVAFIKDWLHKNRSAKSHPFYILELGTGSGRFSFYVVKVLSEILDGLGLEKVKICYIMSDFTENNIQYWETHPALKPYIDKGIIDFALYDMEEAGTIKLQKKGIYLSKEELVNPLIVFANYIFDTITHDAFIVRENKLYELLFSFLTTEANMDGGKPKSMEELSVEYNIREIEDGYYNDKNIDSILHGYKKNIEKSSFLFPIGTIKAIKFLSSISNDKLFIIATDKGYNTTESLQNLSYPSISFHGSFSLMVNFHALAQYFKNTGGDGHLQQARKGIKTSVFAKGFKFADFPELSLAIKENLDGFSPGDYFVLHTRIGESFQECSLATLAAHMQLANWDPHIYLKLSNYIISKVPEEESETIDFMEANMPTMAKNYYYLPQSQCVLFDIGVFFHTIKKYELAEYYYQEATTYLEGQSSLYYNLALCQHHLGNDTQAMVNFHKSLDADPSSREAKEWIEYLESEAIKKD